MRPAGKTVLGALALVGGSLLVLAAGTALAGDLLFDSYPDTILDHPLEAGLLLIGLALVGGGIRLVRRGKPDTGARPRGDGSPAAAGGALVLLAAVMGWAYATLCGFGCSRGEYWGGLAGFATLAALGLVLAVRAAPRRAE